MEPSHQINSSHSTNWFDRLHQQRLDTGEEVYGAPVLPEQKLPSEVASESDKDAEASQIPHRPANSPEQSTQGDGTVAGEQYGAEEEHSEGSRASNDSTSEELIDYLFHSEADPSSDQDNGDSESEKSTSDIFRRRKHSPQHSRSTSRSSSPSSVLLPEPDYSPFDSPSTSLPPLVANRDSSVTSPFQPKQSSEDSQTLFVKGSRSERIYAHLTISDDQSVGSKIIERNILALNRSLLGGFPEAHFTPLNPPSPSRNRRLSFPSAIPLDWAVYQMQQAMSSKQPSKERSLMARRESENVAAAYKSGIHIDPISAAQLPVPGWPPTMNTEPSPVDLSHATDTPNISNLGLHELEEYILTLRAQAHLTVPRRPQILYRIITPKPIESRSSKSKRKSEIHMPYLDHPQWVRGQGSERHARSSVPLDNLELYLERNKDISFIVYRDFTFGSDSVLLDPFELRKAKDHVLSHTSEQIQPVSPDLVKAIHALLESEEEFSNILSEYRSSKELRAPYLLIYHTREYFQDLLQDIPEPGRQQLVQFQGWVISQYGEEYARADWMLSQGLISSPYVKYLFKPGEVLLHRKDDEIRGFMAMDWPDQAPRKRGVRSFAHGAERKLYEPKASRMKGEKTKFHDWTIDGWTWEFDGSFQRENKAFTLEIALNEKQPKSRAHDAAGWARSDYVELADDGATKIVDLTVFPLRFASKALKEQLQQRGSRFWQCRQRLLVSYSGNEDRMQLVSDLFVTSCASAPIQSKFDVRLQFMCGKAKSIPSKDLSSDSNLGCLRELTRLLRVGSSIALIQLEAGSYMYFAWKQAVANQISQAEDRYMVDLSTYQQLHRKEYAVHYVDELGEELLNQDEPPDEQFGFLVPYKIKGYNLRNKKWFDLVVDNISDITWNKKAFQSLVIEPKARDLIRALVSNQIASEKSTDLIAAKGNGLILLLHGGPGTGKTLTAESVAEIAEKPLFRVTCGDIGTKADDVEKYLESVLHLGKIWGCVVLLDEADVFLEQRSLEDLQRNALVSVFLRVLEYYEGILVLTSNRVGTFDEAFKSRIQLALHYPKLGPYQRLRIWENFIQRLDAFNDSLVDIADLRDHLEDLKEEEMNGRQIRNAITTARQYAEWKGTKMTYLHLKDVIEISGRFDRYLLDLHQGHTEDQLAEDEGLRLAN